MDVNTNEVNPYLGLSLSDGSVKKFDGWDEEDQGLFACVFSGEKWDESKRGIPSTFKLHTNTEHLEVLSSPTRPLEINVNGKAVDEWGKVIHSSTHSMLFEKK